MSHIPLGLYTTLQTTRGRQLYAGLREALAGRPDWRVEPPAPQFKYFPEETYLRDFPIQGFIGDLTSPAEVASLRAHGVRFVNLSNAYPPAGIPAVLNDDTAIGRLAATHFLDRGFAHFAYLGVSGMAYSRERFEGFRDALAAAGRPAPLAVEYTWPEWLAQGPAGIRDLVGDMRQRPLAIFCTQDDLAVRILGFLEDLGLRVPQDLALLGVDGEENFRSMLKQDLSSILPDCAASSRRAVDLLAHLLDGGSAPKQAIRIPPKGIHIGSSSAFHADPDAVVARAVAHIREHSHRHLGVTELAEAVFVSRRSLERCFQKQLGRSPHQEILAARIDRAKELLLAGGESVQAISERCGFEDAAYFIQVFRRLTGTTPGAFRKRKG